MCGIAGFITTGEGRDEMAALRRALARLTHRGPDDEGWLTFPDPPRPGPLVALGNRRLSIIDLSPAGHQPMTTADGRYTLVFNGEIYNYGELRREMEALGCAFHSSSDTEVLLQACATWGRGALSKFEGMFAFALLDRLQRRLLLARDGFGIKPLFFIRTAKAFSFASEIGALLELAGMERRVNPPRLYDYLMGSITDHGEETMLRGMRQIPPGHCVELSLDLGAEIKPVRYWKTDDGEPCHLSIEAASARVRELFLESVRFHLRSDAPVGFALSGGIDSSSIVMAARHLQGPGAELHTFSYLAEDPAISEERYQDLVGQAAGAVMHRLRLEPGELLEDFEHLMAVQVEPFASPTIYAQHRIFRMAHEVGIKVMLGGQGADEVFAGYERYVPARLTSLLRQGRLVDGAHFLMKAGRARDGGRTGLARTSALQILPWKWQERLRRARRRSSRSLWLDYDWFDRAGFVPPPIWQPQRREAMKELLVHTLDEVHLQALLRYEDRNAMAFSIENRVPFLNRDLARFAFSLPEEYLVSPEGDRKAILRHAMRGLTPDPILDRRDKIGFAMPVAQWLIGLRPWVEARLRDAAECPALRPAELNRHWDAVRLTRSLPSAFLVWRWISLAAWASRLNVSFDLSSD